MGSFVLSEAPFLPLMVAHLAFAAAAFQSAKTRSFVLLSVAAGIAAAGAIYMRPSWLLFVPFALVCGMLLSRKRRLIATQSAIGMAVICACLTPWWVRSYRITGHFVLTTLQVGASLFDGLNPMADGSSNMSLLPRFGAVAVKANGSKKFTVVERYVEWNDGRKQTLERTPLEKVNEEYRKDRALQLLSIEWSKSHPLRVLQLAGIKFSRMWNVIPNEPMFRSWTTKLVVALTFTPLFLLGCYGAIKFTRLGWPYLLAGLPAVYFTLLHVIFVASIRYREPVMLGLIVLASAVIVSSRRQTCRPAVAGAGVECV
jgi:hypothetical protein